MRGSAPWLLSLALVAPLLAAPPALAADAPLVLAPAATPRVADWPSPADLALDFAVPALASGAMCYLLSVQGQQSTPLPQGGVDIYGAGLMAATVTVPPGALIALRDHPPGFDGYFASLSGGVLGLLLGYAISTLVAPNSTMQAALAPGATELTGASPSPMRFALLAIGQGLGASAGYVLYEHAKPYLSNLNELPAHRTDDPNNWDRWNERHHNE